MISKMLLKFDFMIFDHSLADKLTSFNSSLIDDHLVMFSKLNFIVLNSLVQSLVSVISFLDIVNDLKKVDGNWKDLSSGL